MLNTCKKRGKITERTNDGLRRKAGRCDEQGFIALNALQKKRRKKKKEEKEEKRRERGKEDRNERGRGWHSDFSAGGILKPV